MKGARLVAGAVFVVFGLGKFVDHAGELSSFESYGIPWPEVMVYVVGVLQVGEAWPCSRGWRLRRWRS